VPHEDKTRRQTSETERKAAARKPAEEIDPRRPLGTTDWAILYAGE
jgi:hypothetical protein